MKCRDANQGKHFFPGCFHDPGKCMCRCQCGFTWSEVRPAPVAAADVHIYADVVRLVFDLTGLQLLQNSTEEQLRKLIADLGMEALRQNGVVS